MGHREWMLRSYFPAKNPSPWQHCTRNDTGITRCPAGNAVSLACTIYSWDPMLQCSGGGHRCLRGYCIIHWVARYANSLCRPLGHTFSWMAWSAYKICCAALWATPYLGRPRVSIKVVVQLKAAHNSNCYTARMAPQILFKDLLCFGEQLAAAFWDMTNNAAVFFYDHRL